MENDRKKSFSLSLPEEMPKTVVHFDLHQAIMAKGGEVHPVNVSMS
jgi:hypothetical protein